MKKNSSSHTKQLEVISNNYYSLEQIKELYEIGGRFEIKQKLQFKDMNLVELYQNIQNYLEELFNQRQYYLEDILTFFDLPPKMIE